MNSSNIGTVNAVSPCGDPGTALPQLGGANGGVPVHVNMCAPLTANHVNMCAPLTANLCASSSRLCMPTQTATSDPNVDWFGMWYVDNATYNKPIVETLTLGGQVDGANSATCNTGANPACTSFQLATTAFYPIDGLGWGNGSTRTSRLHVRDAQLVRVLG
jgi:hypothetical protein